MADNTQLPVPNTNGDIIATDDISGVKYQRVKLIHGAEGVNDGDVSSVNPLPMTASNVTGKFREAFEGSGLNGAKWVETKATNDITMMDGNAVAASYRVISKSPWDAGSETTLECLTTFTMPSEIAISLHLSQRTAIGQEFNIEIVDTDAPLAPIPDIAIASISQTTTTLTVNTVTPHGLSVGKSIGIRDVSDTRLNFNQLVVSATPTTTRFTCTSGPNGTITSATIGAINNSGFVYFRERLSRANDGTSIVFENGTATNASFYIRSNGGDALPSGTFAGNHAASISSTASVQAVNAALNYAFQPTSEYRCLLKSDYTNWQDVAVDTASVSSSRYYRRQVCPNPEKTYKLQIKAKNVKAMSRPVAGIISISKTGTTTATVTTDRPHGLTTTSYVQTVTGTSPSFTRAVNRLQRSDDAPLRVQFINRTIVPNTLNSTSPTYYVEGCAKFNVTVRCSAQSTAATIAVQLSADGTNWFNHATTITTAVGIVQAKISDEQWKFARLIVVSAGTGVTLGEAVITGVL